MTRLAIVAALVACGSQRPAPEPVPIKPPPPAPPTCGEVGVILRGEIEVDGDALAAGPAREAAIANACAIDRWSAEIISCVASTADPEDCLAKLDAAQRTAYDDRLRAWAETYGGAFGGDVYGGDIAPPDPFVPCEDAIGDPARYRPALGDRADERDWDIALRRKRILHECDHGWSESVKSCLATAASPDDVEACFDGELDTAERDELADQLAEVDRLAAKIAAARKKPRTIGCKQVVEAHYGDKRWTKKLDGYKAAERKKMISASRDKMAKTCAADSWDETLRACLVALGGDACFEAIGRRSPFGFPAAGVVGSTGLPDCDAYGAAIAKMAACDKLPQQTRDALREVFDVTLARIAGLDAAAREQLAQGCKAGLEAIEGIVAQGC